MNKEIPCFIYDRKNKSSPIIWGIKETTGNSAFSLKDDKKKDYSDCYFLSPLVSFNKEELHITAKVIKEFSSSGLKKGDVVVLLEDFSIDKKFLKVKKDDIECEYPSIYLHFNPTF